MSARSEVSLPANFLVPGVLRQQYPCCPIQVIATPKFIDIGKPKAGCDTSVNRVVFIDSLGKPELPCRSIVIVINAIAKRQAELRSLISFASIAGSQAQAQRWNIDIVFDEVAY